MSLSKFDMAALVQGEDGRTRLAICGKLTAEEGRTLETAAIFCVVHQGDSVVRGRGMYRKGQNKGQPEWGACAELTQPLSVGQAVAMGLVVSETTNPVAERDPVGFSDSFGFTTFTWMQDIMIRDGLPPEEPDRIDPCAGEGSAATVPIDR
jgi:hypothetical protein